ncbi:hypothetical protein F2Q69_00001448 [Brassica cretica]|uniref:Uncharacterized protein n=1 Tax=Brassica cretica TaxID=69181 RepID=A0A8S9PF53_BRACR|nr:hypothetical protein F2Q69_00001448 [Brassica cretica]
MDSGDDMLDMYSGEDDFYSDDYKDSDNDDDDDDDDDGEPDYGFVEEEADDSAMIASHRSQLIKGYFYSLLSYGRC